MSLIRVHPTVFEQLKQAYRGNFGASSGSVVQALNEKYQHHPGKDTGQNLISDKAIRLFFGASDLPRTRLQNLNFLCGLLLGVESYDAAVANVEKSSLRRRIERQPLQSATLSDDWLNGYLDSIKERLGTIKVLDMQQPLSMNNLFTEVVVSETIQRRQISSIEHFENQLRASRTASPEPPNSNRLNSPANEKHLNSFEVVKQHRRLMVYGKPGAGKSTLLKGIALYFPEQNSTEQLVPIYIALKEFVDNDPISDLFDIILHEFDPFLNEPKEIVQSLLLNNQCLILLDGLDEVSKQDVNEVYRKIDNLVKRYPRNRFIVTCRTAACDYNFNGFQDVEVVDFDNQQINQFIRGWFSDRDKVADDFLQALKNNPSVKELTTRPLLLTMLCTVFEYAYEIPKNRLVLYEDVVDVLLRRWDASRRIDRKRGSAKLSRQRLHDLFSDIAYSGLKQGKHFWYDWELEESIQKFIQDELERQIDDLDLDTREILRIIQADIGLLVEQAKSIFSFSHVTFQKYFAASHLLDQGIPDLIYRDLNEHLLDEDWQEVFTLIPSKLRNNRADEYLKHLFSRANQCLESQELQDMLRWLNKTTTDAAVNTAAWRAYYLLVDFDADLYIDFDHKPSVRQHLIHKLASGLHDRNQQRGTTSKRSPLSYIQLLLGTLHALADDYAVGQGFRIKDELILGQLGIESNDFLNEKLQLVIRCAKELGKNELAIALTKLQKGLPLRDAPSSKWQNWAHELQEAMIKHLDVGYMKIFSEKDIKSLDDYFYLANLILDCIQEETYSTKELREYIIDHLLLPVGNIPSELIFPYHQCEFCL